MPSSRRQFLTRTALGLAGLASSGRAGAAGPPPGPAAPPTAPASPSTFTSAPPVGPAVDAATFAQAEKLMQVTLTPKERAQAAESWRQAMAPLTERRTGPRKLALEEGLAPASRWDPQLPGVKAGPARDRFVGSGGPLPPLPARDEDLAFAPLTSLSRWLQARKVTSERLTTLYLDRLARYQPTLRCSITITRTQALAAARQADAEIARGKYRGPLHGVPWGAKDLVDTAGIPTTWGAEPFKDRVPTRDAATVRRLGEAGAVLVAKLSLGALALNDIWFGGQTMNPWLVEEGSSGSSAGPGAAVAAGLVGFALGSETLGSIMSPSTRCGVVGLRPTFGRVPRTGAMTLSWSLDKLGPMCRSVEDTLLVLRALSGPDAGDVSSVPCRLDFDATRPVKGLRVGYVPAWLHDEPATDVDRAALEQLRAAGLTPVEVMVPNWPYASLLPILFAETAASFEEQTLTHVFDQLKMQTIDGWPNTIRQARFLSAVELVQADRLRRKVAQMMAALFERVDVLLVPALRDEMLTISNYTGHPALALPTGYIEVKKARSDWAPDPAHPLPTFATPRRVPHGPALIGRLFDEGTLGRVGMALEREARMGARRPPTFA
jgi:Asp-tRNA(Asn)/Glu-tRNA(Gln) amidotransferase A subunit family amidase